MAKRWEYHTVAIDQQISDEELQKILSDLGVDGWELMVVWKPTEKRRTTWVFKREMLSQLWELLYKYVDEPNLDNANEVDTGL